MTKQEAENQEATGKLSPQQTEEKHEYYWGTRKVKSYKCLKYKPVNQHYKSSINKPDINCTIFINSPVLFVKLVSNKIYIYISINHKTIYHP